MTFLDEVIAGVRQSLNEGYYDVNADANEKAMVAKKGKKGTPLKATLQNRFTIIAEIKPRSPTTGTLYTGTAMNLAQTYAEAGAGAVSVLCEPKHFNGRLQNLTEAKTATTHIPILAKDFVVSERQLNAYAAHNADAVLLIYELFERKKTDVPLDAMIDAAHLMGLEVLLEVHSPQSLKEALKTGADVVGINNRDLDDLSLNVLHFQNVLNEAKIEPKNCKKPIIAESGFASQDDVLQAKVAGLKGVLVGTSLLESTDLGAALTKLTRT